MTARLYLLLANIGLWLIGVAAALALAHYSRAAIVTGTIGVTLDVGALAFLLRKESRR